MPDDPHSLVAPYALDALDEREEKEFEQHLALCERCREELAGLREAAAARAVGAPRAAPPPELRQRILDQARSERPNVVPLRRPRRWTPVLAATTAIAAAAAIVLGIWGASLNNSSDPLESVLSQPGAKLVSMGSYGGVAVGPDGQAVLALAVRPAPASKTYEAWVIHEFGNPTPAGLFQGRAGTSVVKISKPVPAGSIVAVTVEPSGGSAQPTSKPFVLSRPVS
jgi:anti-sigma-K factor RskA